jgi:hypothetical protein
MPSMHPTHSQSSNDVFKEEELPFGESLSEKFSCSREAFYSINSSTYYYLYHDLFNVLTLQETTRHPTQIDSMGMTHFEILDGVNIHTQEREDKTSSYERIKYMPYQPFPWDIGNVIVDVYQIASSSFSYSFLINSEYSCSSIPLMDIIDTSGSHHCLEITSHTMVDASLCRSFVSTNSSQVNGYLKWEPREAC